MPKHFFLSILGLLALLPFRVAAADPVPDAASAIRTPPAPATPRINGPRIFGARPGHPFFYHLPVTGQRPVTCTASGLPAGLTLDAATGNLTGTASARGSYPVTFTAINAAGKTEATVNIVIGDTIALTPPMGFNSWNFYARTISAEKVRAAADAMVSSGLIDHGWTYVNIDDCWQGQTRDAQGSIAGNEKFPDLKGLGDYIHGLGLKFGIYSSPGTQTCAGFLGSYEHEGQDARTYAEWGVDYVKYDLCTYSQIIREHLRARTTELIAPEQRSVYAALTKEHDNLLANRKRTPEQDARLKATGPELEKFTATLDAAKLKTFSLEEQQIPYQVFGQALGKVPRDIVYSFCQYGNAYAWEWAAEFGANCWRTGGDIQANWKSMSTIGFRQDPLAKYAGPGHWNDPDMLEVGVRRADQPQDSGLTVDESYTHMTLWCMLASPLLIGCDMSQLDPLTLSLFSNDEVLAVDQDVLGKQGHRLRREGPENSGQEVWIKPLADGTLAVAFFNRGEAPARMGVQWAELKITGTPVARDLWRQKEVPVAADGMALEVAAHGAELFRVGGSASEERPQ